MHPQAADAHRPERLTETTTWEDWMDWDCTGNSIPEQAPATNLPNHATAKSKPQHPSSMAQGCTNAQSPKKRKSSSSDEAFAQTRCQISEPSTQAKSHSIVEKRYRMNLNQKISDLGNCLPNLRMETTTQDQTFQTGPPKHNKATVLTEAMCYIKYLEEKNKHLEQANVALRARSRPVLLQGPVNEESMEVVSPTAIHSDIASHDAPLLTLASDAGTVASTLLEPASPVEETSSVDPPRMPQGMIRVPDEFRRMWNTTAQPTDADLDFHNNDSEEELSGESIALKGRKYVGRLMIGSLAGLMVLDGLTTSRPSKREDRGLFGVPILHTVWVPGHHAVPELAALIIETVAYLIRQLIGDRYAQLTGRNEGEEITRIRAWDIAIDAQLSGGDQEISRSRLVLTLWAAGTLPDSPARLMLKALHIRVLFFQPSRFVFVCRVLHKVAMRLAFHQWTKAFTLQQQMGSTTWNKDHEVLPKHLMALLEQPSDKIMTDKIVHRAYNLAWSHSISGDLLADDTGEVIEDSAMCGPLDALASSFSSYKLEMALRESADRGQQDWKSLVCSNLHLAVRTAPPGSIAEARALTAHALLTAMNINESRDFSLALRQVVGSSRFQPGLPHDSNDSGYGSMDSIE